MKIDAGETVDALSKQASVINMWKPQVFIGAACAPWEALWIDTQTRAGGIIRRK